MALQELRVNKLRTFLSLFGITIGIFCIIGVLATVNSLESKIQSDIKSLGTNTIYVMKFPIGDPGNNDYPWWKYVNRPQPKYADVSFVKERSTLAKYVCFFASTGTNVQYGKTQLNNVGIFGVSEEFNKIQTIDIAYGRYLSESEFQSGSSVGVIGFDNAERIFGRADKAVGKPVVFDGKKITIVGVIKKQGQSFGPGFDYDYCIILAYKTYGTIYNVKSDWGDTFLMVNGKDGVPAKAIIDELEGIMRQARRLSPQEDDNFALNDISVFAQQVSGFFGTVNIGGWAIAGLSLIVGAFGVANIMFVTVRERTSQIGLKKAIGAKKRTILTEFLLESAFLCILGGLFGLLLVWLLALLLGGVLPFPIIIAGDEVLLAFILCVVLGILAGIIPASIAAKMNPVVAIRSK